METLLWTTGYSKIYSQKKAVPYRKRKLSKELVADEGISVSRACKIASLPSSQYYHISSKDDREVFDMLQELAFKHPSY